MLMKLKIFTLSKRTKINHNSSQLLGYHFYYAALAVTLCHEAF